jgi:hypothetical protein
MTATLNQIDAGGPTDYAVLEIGTAGMALTLCEIELEKPSFSVSNAAGGPPVTTAAHLALLGVPLSDDVPGASPGGTAAVGRIVDHTGAVIVAGLTVGTSGADINLNSTTLSPGQTVTITQGTITHAS